MNLIKVEQSVIGNAEIQTINARELHVFLESKQDFSTWIKAKIEKYEFVENQDYLLHKIMEQLPSGAKHKIDYHISISMAKELSMVENNDKGKQARKYFIECESKLQQVKPKTTLEIIAAQTQILIEQERQLQEHEDRIKRVEAKQSAFEDGFKYYTVLGYCAYKGINVDIATASRIGRKASVLSKQKDQPIDRIKDPRFGYVNGYHESILDVIIADLI